MTPQEIIASGKLELYVCGSLPQEELAEVEEAISANPEVKAEIEIIEESLIILAEAVAPPLPSMIWSYIFTSINKVRKLNDSDSGSTNWAAITGWAAAILCIGGIFWMLNMKNELEDSLQVTTTENRVLEDKLSNAETQLAETNTIMEVLRSRDYNTYILPGNQAVAPEAFAKVYYNKKDKVAYIDARGLPEAPRGKVYQVWSLIMQPLTPRNVGLLVAGTELEDGVYRFDNIPDPEAFGITLEPEGGSEGPTLSQLYTLGTVGQ